jgi:hypothetical protein
MLRNSYRNNYQNQHDLQMQYCNLSSLGMPQSILSIALPTSNKARAAGTLRIARLAPQFDASLPLLLATQA